MERFESGYDLGGSGAGELTQHLTVVQEDKSRPQLDTKRPPKGLAATVFDPAEGEIGIPGHDLGESGCERPTMAAP